MRLIYVDLAALDTLESEAVGVFCFEDVRPLQGVSDLLDWRVCGTLSRALLQKRCMGTLGEVLMLPVRGRLGLRRLFLFGLGHSEDLSPGIFSECAEHACSIVRQAGALSMAFAVPVIRTSQNRTSSCYDESFFLSALPRENTTDVTWLVSEAF